MADRQMFIEIVVDDKGAVKKLAEVDDHLKRTKKSGEEAGGGVGQMTKAMTLATAAGTAMGNIISRVVVSGFNLLVGEMGRAIELSASYTKSVNGLVTVANAMGVSAQGAKQAMIDLTRDGLMKPTEAAGALKNLLQSGFGLQQATNLIKTFKDSAIYGAQGMYTVGQAVLRTTDGIRFLNSALTDSSGLGENLSQILKRNGINMATMGDFTRNSAARLAVYNGFMQAGAVFAGASEKAQNTYNGAMDRATNAYETLLASVGAYITENATVQKVIGMVADKMTDLMLTLSQNDLGFKLVTDAILYAIKGFDALLMVIDMAVRAWNFQKLAINGTIAVFAEVSKAILGFQLATLQAIASVPGATTVMSGLSESITRLQGTYDLASSVAHNFGQAAKDNTKVLLEGNPTIGKWREGLASATKTLEATRGKTVELGVSQRKTTEDTKNLGDKADKTKTQVQELSKKAADLAKEIEEARKRGATGTEILKEYGAAALKVAENAKFLRVDLKGATSAVADLAAQMQMVSKSEMFRDLFRNANATMREQADKLFANMAKSAQAGVGLVTKAVQDNLKLVTDAQQAATDTEMRRIMSASRFETYQLEQRRDREIEALDKSDANWEAHAQTIRDAYAVMVADVIGQTTTATSATTNWANALANVAAYIAQIADASGNPALKNLAGVMGTFGIASTAQQEFGRTNPDGTFSKATWGIGSALKNADGSTNWGNVGAAGAGLVTGGMNVWSATDVAGRGNRAMAGAKAGAQAGAMFGPYGALIGMGVGALVGALRNPGFEQEMKRIANDFGVNISEKLAREIDKLRKTFGGDRVAAEIFSLDKIIAEAGGVTNKNVAKLTDRLRDVFVMVETGKFSAEQATKVLDSAFPAFAEHLRKSGALASKTFLEVIELNKRFGTESKEIAAFVAENATSAAASMSSYLSSVTVESESTVNALAASSLAIYAALRANGATTAEALAEIQPAVATLRSRMEEMGITGSEAFQELSDLAAFAADEGVQKATNAVDDLGTLMRDLHNGGMMTSDMFEGLARGVYDVYRNLELQGKGGEQAWRIMQPQLQTIWQMMEDFGYKVDETTQGLIDQARAAGLVGDAFRPAGDIMKDLLSEIRDILGDIRNAFVGVGDAARRAGEEAAAAFPDGYPQGGSRGGGDYDVHTGGVIGRLGVRRFHSGGLAGDEVPAILQTGEGVLNRRAMGLVGGRGLAALNRGGGLGGSEVVNVTFNVAGYLDSEESQERLTDMVTKRVARELRKRRIA
jgi:hypothetical protein